MFDEESTTIQTEEEGLFDDFEEAEEETPKVAEEETKEAETEPPVEQEEVTEEAPFLEIKFNKETKNLTRDEARELAQKGMNYDRFYGELDQLARMNGMSVGDYINSLRETQERFEINKEVRELSKKYPNADKEILQELATKRVDELRRQKEEESREGDDRMRQEIERQLEVFEKHYPDVDPNSLDQKVIDLMSDGYTILEAYSIWKSSEDAKQKKIDESKQKVTAKNEENRKRSFGNTSTVGAIDTDAFLEGFFKS